MISFVKPSHFHDFLPKTLKFSLGKHYTISFKRFKELLTKSSHCTIPWVNPIKAEQDTGYFSQALHLDIVNMMDRPNMRWIC